jgi:hypothetical protein
MEKEIKKLLPLEFQKINKNKKNKTPKKINEFVEVEFYQTTRFKPEAFYKPISKIFPFDF